MTDTEGLLSKLRLDAKAGGYFINPDNELTQILAKGLLANEKRYGYMACPCRLASGNKEKDLDMICPCDYRDIDLTEFGCCYCALYVSKEIYEGKKKAASIPDRRKKTMEKQQSPDVKPLTGELKYPVLRCKVCGYLCARDSAPEICPICKAGKERFERFL